MSPKFLHKMSLILSITFVSLALINKTKCQSELLRRKNRHHSKTRVSPSQPSNCSWSTQHTKHMQCKQGVYFSSIAIAADGITVTEILKSFTHYTEVSASWEEPKSENCKLDANHLTWKINYINFLVIRHLAEIITMGGEDKTNCSLIITCGN